MQIIDAMRNKIYLGIAVAAAVFMFFFYPWVQTLGLQTDLWYSIIPLPNLFLFLVFSAMFGLFVSYQIYRFRGPKTCKISKSGSAAGTAGTAFGFLIGVCPACFGFASLLLPLGVVTVLVQFGPIFIAISILLMAYSLHKNEAFKKRG